MTSNDAPRGAGQLRHAAPKLEVAWGPERGERNLSSVHARLARRRLGIGAAAVLSVAAAAALVLVLFQRSPTRPGALVAASVPSAVRVNVSPVPSPTTTFADGSQARVARGGQLVVKSMSVSHIESELVSGAAEFEVTKHAERDFVVLAGPVLVRVVGTKFRVERAGERTRVSVSEGRVEVQAGDARVLLEAGESRFFPSAEPQAMPEARVDGRARFLELGRAGQLKAAYQLLGVGAGLLGSSANAEELMLAADAARVSGHPEQAVGYLRRVTSDHSADSRAPLAAFTLGRLQLSQLGHPAEAAEAFALARRLKPSGSLAEDALARESEARLAAGSTEQARSLAKQYLAQYSQGKHRSTLERIAAEAGARPR